MPLVVIAGKEYGSGSSRDWAAKGPALLGVRAVLAESYERIHRSNLLMMGVLPLQFADGEGREALGLTGRELFSVEGVEGGAARTVTVRADDREFRARIRLDTPRERVPGSPSCCAAGIETVRVVEHAGGCAESSVAHVLVVRGPRPCILQRAPATSTVRQTSLVASPALRIAHLQ